MFRIGVGKRKKKAEPNIEFVSPYPIEDCVWQLQNFPGVDKWFPVKTRIELSQADDETWQFIIHKTYFSVWSIGTRNPLLMYFKLRANGSLRSTPSDTALVVGKVEISEYTHFVNGLLSLLIPVAIVVLLTIFPYSGQLLFLTFFLIAGVLMPILVTWLGLIPIIQDQYLLTLKSELTNLLGSEDPKSGS